MHNGVTRAIIDHGHDHYRIRETSRLTFGALKGFHQQCGESCGGAIFPSAAEQMSLVSSPNSKAILSSLVDIVVGYGPDCSLSSWRSKCDRG